MEGMYEEHASGLSLVARISNGLEQSPDAVADHRFLQFNFHFRFLRLPNGLEEVNFTFSQF